MVKAEDVGNFFRIPADSRDLNYSLYFDKGNKDISKQEDYNSHNTRRLTIDELIKKLSSIDYVQNELKKKYI